MIILSSGEIMGRKDKRWVLQRKRDFYYKLAKKLKYRSRASFKLMQLNEKFIVIKPGKIVLDLGCATGKISEYISDLTNAQITGIDYVKNAIKRAKERTFNKSSKLTFQHMDFNNLKFSE